MGAFILLYPGVRVKTAIFFLFRTFKIPALYYLGYWFIVQLFYGILSLGPGGWAFGGGVAYWGHIGGFVAGLAITFLVMMLKSPPSVDPLAHLNDDD